MSEEINEVSLLIKTGLESIDYELLEEDEKLIDSQITQVISQVRKRKEHAARFLTLCSSSSYCTIHLMIRREARYPTSTPFQHAKDNLYDIMRYLKRIDPKVSKALKRGPILWVSCVFKNTDKTKNDFASVCHVEFAESDYDDLA